MYCPNLDALTDEEREMVEKNKNLIWHVYNNMDGYLAGAGNVPMFEENYMYDEEDYFSIGVIALCQAVKTYKPDKGALSTYCETVIRMHFLQLVKYMKRRLNRGVAMVSHYDRNGNYKPEYAIEYADYEWEPSERHWSELDIVDIRRAATSIRMTGMEFIIMCENIIGSKSQSEVAERLGVSQPQVSRMRRKLIQRLKREFERTEG